MLSLQWVPQGPLAVSDSMCEKLGDDGIYCGLKGIQKMVKHLKRQEEALETPTVPAGVCLGSYWTRGSPGHPPPRPATPSESQADCGAWAERPLFPGPPRLGTEQAPRTRDLWAAAGAVEEATLLTLTLPGPPAPLGSPGGDIYLDHGLFIDSMWPQSRQVGRW